MFVFTLKDIIAVVLLLAWTVITLPVMLSIAYESFKKRK